MYLATLEITKVTNTLDTTTVTCIVRECTIYKTDRVDICRVSKTRFNCLYTNLQATSLKRHTLEPDSVPQGSECTLSFDKKLDVQVGDMVYVKERWGAPGVTYVKAEEVNHFQ